MSGAIAPVKKVLLVEDDKVTNLMHARLIKRTGLIDHIDVATDGVAALEYLQTHAEAGDTLPEIILLDINMPRMDGFEFLESYSVLPDHFKHRDTLIVMLSTSVLRADQERAKADPNVHAFLSKPVGTEDIVHFVQAYQDRLAM